MIVLFYGSVLDFTNGEKLLNINDCSSIRTLIDKLSGQYGKNFEDFLLGNETCFFLVNGKGIMMTGGLDTILKPGDKIEVLPFTEAG